MNQPTSNVKIHHVRIKQLVCKAFRISVTYRNVPFSLIVIRAWKFFKKRYKTFLNGVLSETHVYNNIIAQTFYGTVVVKLQDLKFVSWHPNLLESVMVGMERYLLY